MTYNAKLGLGLFLLYSAIYAGFVGLNAFAPERMEATPIAGLNIAILYGFGLIAIAFLLSAIYGVASRDEQAEQDAG